MDQPQYPTEQPEQIPATPPDPQPSPFIPAQKSSAMPAVVAFVFAAIIFGAGGYYVGKFMPSAGTVVTSPTPATFETTPSPSPSIAQVATPVSIPGWNQSEIPELKMKFQYPAALSAFGEINDTTVFAGDNQYWIAPKGTGDGGLHLTMYLYKSTKNPLTWFETDGVTMYRTYASEMAGNEESTVTYTSEPALVDGKEAYDITITSKGFEGPKPPVQYVRVLSHNGYILMAEYFEVGDTVIGESSLETSRKIISTFNFAE